MAAVPGSIAASSVIENILNIDTVKAGKAIAEALRDPIERVGQLTQGTELSPTVNASVAPDSSSGGFSAAIQAAAEAGGPLSSLSNALDAADKAQSVYNGLNKAVNLYEAWSGGHLDAAIEVAQAGDFGAFGRAVDLAKTFGSPGNVPSAVDFGELGIGTTEAMAGFGVSSQLASMTAAGSFAPGSAATAYSVFGTGTGFGATGAAGGSAAAAGVGASSLMAFAGPAAIAGIVMLGMMGDDNTPMHAQQNVDVVGGRFQLGSSSASASTLERPQFEADFLFELNDLASSGVISIGSISGSIPLVSGEKGFSRAEDIVAQMVQSGAIQVHNSSAFSNVVSAWAGRRTKFLTDRGSQMTRAAIATNQAHVLRNGDGRNDNSMAQMAAEMAMIGVSQPGAVDQNVFAKIRIAEEQRINGENEILALLHDERTADFVTPSQRASVAHRLIQPVSSEGPM